MSVPFPAFSSGNTISSSQANSNNSTIVNEITNSIPRDGQAAPTANLPMGAFKLTGLGVGSAATDSISLGQAQAQAFIWCGTLGGTANAITATPSPAITAYAAGQRFVGIASADSSSTVTLNVSAVAAKAVQNNAAAMSATIKLISGKLYEFIYDGTQFQVSKWASPEGVLVTQTAADAAYQPLDADLTAIAALTTTSFGRGVLALANAAALSAYGKAPKIVNYTHDTSTTGDQAMTGAGFTPRFAIIIGVVTSTKLISIGATDGTNHACFFQEAAGSTWLPSTSIVLAARTSTGVTEAQAIYKTFDSDGMTITWSKTGSPTGPDSFAVIYIP